MRFARLFSLALLATLTVGVHAQKINQQNPASQINWGITCAAATPVYNTYTKRCVAMVGDTGPTGPAGTISNFTGAATGGALNASVNSQINVMAAPYLAKGDCVTDDHDAIIAAQTAAQTYAVGNSQPAALYFPKPPGGCYLSSTIIWTGVSMLGQPGGQGVNSPQQYNVTIKGKPGQDILATPDPSITGSYVWNISWTIRDISFLVDDSVTNIHAHRWPGKWFDDAGMVSGSSAFTSSRASIGCSDVGQAIQVNGAGVAGANLVTTIASVDPCWANFGSTGTWKKITLATPASTTVTNAHAYLSLLGLPVTTKIGNCAIAFDNADALNTDWPNPAASVGSNGSSIQNVAFNTTSGAIGASNTCGIFSQGAWILYNLTATHLSFGSEVFSIVDGAPAENNSYNSGFGDFQDWEHITFVTVYYPAIFYNGGESKFKDVEILAFAGPQFIPLSNLFADVAGWDIDLMEMESWSLVSDTVYGLRTTGQGFKVTGEMSISADPNNHAWIDSVDLSCPLGCFADAGGINLYGYGNSVQNATGVPLVNKGKGNTATRYYNASFPNGTPAPSPTTLLPIKGVPNLLAGIEPDFAADGFPATPYRHEDFFLTPQDIFVGTAGTDLWSSVYQDDANSLTKGEVFVHSGFNLTTFQPFESTNPGCPGCMTIGTNFPAAKGTLYVSLKCATATTTQINFNSSGGTNNNQTLSCSTTTLQTYALPFDFTSATGNIGFKNNGSAGQDFWLAWAYIAIAPQLPAGAAVGGAKIPGTSATTPTPSAGVCWKTTTTLGTCTAGTWPSCTTCN